MTEFKGLRKHVGHAPVLQCGGSAMIFDEDFRVLMMRSIRGYAITSNRIVSGGYVYAFPN